jgi:hypothetical protein
MASSNTRFIDRPECCKVANHISKQRSARPIRPVAALPSVDSDRLGLSSSAIRLSIDSSFTGSTLSAVIKVRINGSDNAPLSVNSWLAVFMKYPLVVSGIYMRPKPDSRTVTLSVGPFAHHLPLVDPDAPVTYSRGAVSERARLAGFIRTCGNWLGARPARKRLTAATWVISLEAVPFRCCRFESYDRVPFPSADTTQQFSRSTTLRTTTWASKANFALLAIL